MFHICCAVAPVLVQGLLMMPEPKQCKLMAGIVTKACVEADYHEVYEHQKRSEDVNWHDKVHPLWTGGDRCLWQ